MMGGLGPRPLCVVALTCRELTAFLLVVTFGDTEQAPGCVVADGVDRTLRMISGRSWPSFSLPPCPPRDQRR